MPLDLCHPTAPHEKLKLPEWYVSSLMMDRALDAICRRVKKFDRKHDIPYLAGYSLDGKTICIDRHMPASFKFKGRTDQLGLHFDQHRPFSCPARRGREDADREEAMAETLYACPASPGVRSPRVNNFRAGPGASQIASASTYCASGATERPRTSYRSMSRATKPDDFASSTK
jgi:hypothetical protein